jgi:microcompartment protein CcmK/EutM
VGAGAVVVGAAAGGVAAGAPLLTTGDDTGGVTTGAGVGITGIGGAVLVTTGAAARALASALTAPELVWPAPALGAAGGTREKVLVTTGMRWAAVRCT